MQRTTESSETGSWNGTPYYSQSLEWYIEQGPRQSTQAAQGADLGRLARLLACFKLLQDRMILVAKMCGKSTKHGVSVMLRLDSNKRLHADRQIEFSSLPPRRVRLELLHVIHLRRIDWLYVWSCAGGRTSSVGFFVETPCQD